MQQLREYPPESNCCGQAQEAVKEAIHSFVPDGFARSFKERPVTRSPRIMDSVLFGAASVAALSWVWLARREREPEVEYSHAETIEAITNAYGYGNRIRKNFFLDFVRYTHVNHGSYGTCPSDVWNAALKAMLQVRPCSLVVFIVYGGNIYTVATSVPLAGGELP
jgi:hypothetical protein